MAGFQNRTDLLTESMTNGKKDVLPFLKGTVNVLSGSWSTLWTIAGGPDSGAAPAATPGTSYSVDQSTSVVGTLKLPDRLPDLKYLSRLMAANGSGVGPVCLMLYDRLVAVSGISIATTGAKTVNSAALPRYSGTAALHNEVWLEVTTALTTTAAIVNLNSYTAADGTAAQAGGSVTFPSSTTAASLMVQLPLDASKRGVRSVEAGLNVGTASATGVVNVVILRPLARIMVPKSGFNSVSFFDDFLSAPQIFDNAALCLASLSGGTNGVIQGHAEVVYG